MVYQKRLAGLFLVCCSLLCERTCTTTAFMISTSNSHASHATTKKFEMVEIPRLGIFHPKRELLLGVKSGTLTASRISQLSTTQLQAKLSGEDGYDEPREGSSLMENESSLEERMDLGGFAGYLAPYAFALILSIGVTAAFVKFVLLDY